QEVAQQHWKEASGHYQQVVAKQPANVAALNNLAWALFQLKDPAALAWAEKAAALAPRAAPVIDTLGTVQSAAGQHAKAIETLRQAVALAPKSNQFRLHLAQALAASGDKAGAKKEVETVLKEVSQGPLADEAKALAARL
ncbi:MAG: tetratricopeptide repeat protein, partial [Burkholderiaceae bacterium]|nr:tetratricopeptide repeat protein [Burkholderiaceae bacterium]